MLLNLQQELELVRYIKKNVQRKACYGRKR
jgi:hypothetical protein